MVFQIHLSFDPVAIGWARLAIIDGQTKHQIDCSWECDTVGGLIRAVANSSEFVKHEIKGTNESHEDVLFTLRRSGDSLEFIAKRRLVTAKRPNWRVIFRYRGELKAVRSMFSKSIREAIEPLGPDAYRKLWGHLLPVKEYAVLGCF